MNEAQGWLKREALDSSLQSPESKEPGSGSCFYRTAPNKDARKTVFWLWHCGWDMREESEGCQTVITNANKQTECSLEVFYKWYPFCSLLQINVGSVFLCACTRACGRIYGAQRQVGYFGRSSVGWSVGQWHQQCRRWWQTDHPDHTQAAVLTPCGRMTMQHKRDEWCLLICHVFFSCAWQWNPVYCGRAEREKKMALTTLSVKLIGLCCSSYLSIEWSLPNELPM